MVAFVLETLPGLQSMQADNPHPLAKVPPRQTEHEEERLMELNDPALHIKQFGDPSYAEYLPGPQSLQFLLFPVEKLPAGQTAQEEEFKIDDSPATQSLQ